MGTTGPTPGRAQLGLLQKVATLVPLALLSAAASVSIAGAGSGGSPASASADGTLPDGSTVPDEAIEAPASLSTRAQLAPGISGDLDDAVGNAAVNGIPSAALTAYQRAEIVINAADTTCHLPWQLVAAIGRVESDHGRVARQPPRRRRSGPPGHLRHPARRQPRHRPHRRHRRRPARRRRHLRPRGRPDAVHPLDLVGRGRRRRRRRQAQPPRHRRRLARDRGLPLLRRRRPRHRRRPALVGLPLQPQRGVRRPGAGVLRRLRRRRLHLRSQQRRRWRHHPAERRWRWRWRRWWRRWRRWRRWRHPDRSARAHQGPDQQADAVADVQADSGSRRPNRPRSPHRNPPSRPRPPRTRSPPSCRRATPPRRSPPCSPPSSRRSCRPSSPPAS